MAEQDPNTNQVNVDINDDGFIVTLPYDAETRLKISKVPGAAFDKVAKHWKIPKSSEEILDKVVEELHFDVKSIEKDRTSIFELATTSAYARMNEKGIDKGVKPQIDDFIQKDTSHSGEVIHVNGRFAAQLTGAGNENGAEFIKIHRKTALNKSVLNGDSVTIKYNNNLIGEVEAYKSKADKAKEFDANIGSTINGITVNVVDDKFLISFDINSDIKSRLQRIADVVFNNEVKAFEVPLTHKEPVIRAVSDMRDIYVADQKERSELTAYASTLKDGASVRNAFTKDGMFHSGEIIKALDIYVLQDGQKNEIKLHRQSDLSQKITPNQERQKVDIKYVKGRGVIQEKKLEKDVSKSLER